MSKEPKSSGRGTYRSVGTTCDGVRILAPKTKPTHFTTQEIRRTIEKVLRDNPRSRSTEAEAGSGTTPISRSFKRYMTLKDLDVFVNFPFDNDYQAIFHATVYTIVRSGYRARRALEADDAADNRLEKIYGITAECKFGIHDISRTEADGDTPLPRFNMPLELGLFLGARRYGGRAQRAKVRIIFDRERFRFQRYISDIAG